MMQFSVAPWRILDEKHFKAVLEAVGVHDVLSKSQGSSHPHNVVKATFDALLRLKNARTIAKNRGITLEKLFKG